MLSSLPNLWLGYWGCSYFVGGGKIVLREGWVLVALENAPAARDLQAPSTSSQSTVVVSGSGVSAGVPNTSLPGSPSDGALATLVDSTSAPSFSWLFQWSASAARWLFVGGAPAVVSVAAAETTTSTSFAALSTVGPSFTVPRAGSYVVRIGCELAAADSGGTDGGEMSYALGGSAASSSSAAVRVQASGVATDFVACFRELVQSGLSASDAVVCKYRSLNGASTSFQHRSLAVLPVFVT